MLFYFGVRVEFEVEDANERIFLWGQMQTGDFSFGVRIGVEDAKCANMPEFFFFFFSFKLMHSAHGEMQWQKLAERKKSPEIAKLATQIIVFFKERINKIFVNY